MLVLCSPKEQQSEKWSSPIATTSSSIFNRAASTERDPQLFQRWANDVGQEESVVVAVGGVALIAFGLEEIRRTNRKYVPFRLDARRRPPQFPNLGTDMETESAVSSTSVSAPSLQRGAVIQKVVLSTTAVGSRSEITEQGKVVVSGHDYWRSHVQSGLDRGLTRSH
ncbi:hypothetical protein BDZ89DRAFT_1045651 [Hymenopellis radicata]|nr:hypothetical protein BDZ89DRAFT_1045651 [Hymenopellis radicata]